MSPGDRSLSARELETLCTAFLRLPGIRDPNAREMYVEALSRELDAPLSFPRYPDLRHDVWSMLYACQDHPGGIRSLVDFVRPFYQGSIAMRDLDMLVDAMFPEQFLQPAERDELVSLLADVDHHRLLKAFQYAGPLAWRTMVLDLHNPLDIVLRLESFIGGPDSPPPLLMFVDYVAHQLDAVREAAQHRWLDKVGFRKNIPIGRLRALCAATTPRLGEVDRYYFVVQLQPDGVDPDRYLTSAWLQRHGSIEEPLYRNDEALRIEEIVDLLPELLRSAYAVAGVSGGGDLTVEFIVPRSLISLAVDQWQVDKLFPHAFGTRYAVVIRSLDRIRRAELHREWQKKWRWLTVNGHREEPGSIVWLTNRGVLPPQALHSTLLHDDSTVALAMSFPPEASEGLKSDELTAALYAGIPIIIWTRDDSLGSRFEKILRKLLAGHGLLELPSLLLRLRREPDEDSGLGSNVTLIWDDYDRIPESFTRSTRLQAPQTQ